MTRALFCDELGQPLLDRTVEIPKMRPYLQVRHDHYGVTVLGTYEMVTVDAEGVVLYSLVYEDFED